MFYVLCFMGRLLPPHVAFITASLHRVPSSYWIWVVEYIWLERLTPAFFESRQKSPQPEVSRLTLKYTSISSAFPLI